jgi:hypothetical protein
MEPLPHHRHGGLRFRSLCNMHKSITLSLVVLTTVYSAQRDVQLSGGRMPAWGGLLCIVQEGVDDRGAQSPDST